MTREEVARIIVEVGIIPVVRATSATHAQQAAEAVRAGGIPIVEITMTVPGAIELIEKLSNTVGSEVVVGAGTVLDAATGRKCIDAGAEFLVGPGFDAETLQVCHAAGKLM